ncbi:AraC family transcriptional regulator [Marinilactibacillus kalidii]|uniref:AraC family transcriptional regulator n=1 Tax=Marinilactibacillus kalidii TaxID=2820274 RepID=UPI001ABE554A|nr:AraC family transcriptional regulator [Marinilactibacillus kalidii]
MSQNLFTPNPSEKDIDSSLHELAEHGQSLFPVAVHFTNHDKYRNNMIHTHWHREMEILYISRGKMIVEIEGKSYIGNTGDILFIPPNQLHGAISYKHSACAFFAIVFDSFFIKSHFSDLIQQSYIDSLLAFPSKYILHASHNLPNIETLRELVGKIIDEFVVKEPFFELSLKANLLLFIKNLYLNKDHLHRHDHYADSKDEVDSYKCKKIVLYIEEHYQTKITLEEISTHIGFSKEHFCRFFKKYFRMTFVNYLNRMRIKKAEYLLLNTHLKIIDISLETGFEDSNYFTSLFKKETKMTPSNYRKNPSNVTLL